MRGQRRGWRGGPWWADPEFMDSPFVQRALGDRPFAGPPRRMRRGDVRGEVLAALLDGPAHGYEVITRLEQRSGGFWRPSPGSVYPTLQMLEDAGLVRASEVDGRRTYELTDQGRTEAEQHAAKAASAASESGSGDPAVNGRTAVKGAFVHVMRAAAQVAEVGTDEQVARATEILHQARQSLYKILAEA